MVALPDNLEDFKFVYYLDGIQGDGVVNATTADLLKWNRALKNNTLLNESTQKEMLKEHAIVDTVKKSHYGFGVFLEKTALGYLISHSGGWPGYITFLARNVNTDQTFIVLSNNESNSPAISNTLQHILSGKPVIIAYHHKEINLDVTSIQQFVGKYKAAFEFSIERIENKLFIVRANRPKIQLKPELNSKFFYANGSDNQIEFEIDTNKKVVKAWLISYGIKTELVKI